MDNEKEGYTLITAVNPPDGTPPEVTEAMHREIFEVAGQQLANEFGEPQEIHHEDGGSTTFIPEQRNQRGKSFSVSVSAARYQEIFGHTGFKQ